MRTQQEILDRIKAVKEHDLFGSQLNDFLPHLYFVNAKEFLEPGTTEEEWEKAREAAAPPAQCIKEYMSFAWGKANNCRGLSASRSVDHMKAWLWLDGKDELANRLDEIYEFYGKPCLYLVCKEYGIDWLALDDDRWTNDEDGEGLKADDAIIKKFGKEELVRAYT